MAENSSSVPIFSCTALWSGPVNVIGRQCLWDTRDGFLCLVYSVMKTIDNTWS